MTSQHFDDYAANLVHIYRAMNLHGVVIASERRICPACLVDDPFAGRPLPKRLVPAGSVRIAMSCAYSPVNALGLPSFRLPNGQVRK